MKTFKQWIGKVTTIGLGLVVIALSSQPSFADGSLVGSFRGKYQKNGKPRIDLVMRSLTADGRDGSYLGVLLQNDPLKVAVYLIDRMEDGKYVMQPREVTADGEVVGTNNADPSLVLNVTGQVNGRPTFTITNANASNHDGFQGSMIFQCDDVSDLEWLDVNPGTFALDRARIVINGAMVDHEAGLSMTLPPPLSGEFILREKLPGVYTLDNVSVTAIGDLRAKYPSKIILFLRKASWFGSDFFVMIDPNDYGNVLKLKRK